MIIFVIKNYITIKLISEDTKMRTLRLFFTDFHPVFAFIIFMITVISLDRFYLDTRIIMLYTAGTILVISWAIWFVRLVINMYRR
jgi:hypothetical protein